jgi:hypothetical protein
LGGTYRLSNVVLSCSSCNIRRGNDLLSRPIESLLDREKGKQSWRGKRRANIKAMIKSKRRPRERSANLTLHE